MVSVFSFTSGLEDENAKNIRVHSIQKNISDLLLNEEGWP